MKKLLLLALLLAAAEVHAAERTYRKEFPVGAGSRFALNSYKGFIRIRTAAITSIVASARIYPDGESDPAVVDHVQIREKNNAGYVSLEVEFDNNFGRSRGFLGDSYNWPFVDWDIVLPDDASLDLETYKSQIDLELPAGPIQIESYKGTGKISGARNRFKLNTYKGEFDVQVHRLAGLEVETYKGDVTLAVRGARDFSLDAETNRGDLRFEGMSIPVHRERRETRASYSTGTAANRINLETYKGNITVRFIP